MRSHMERLAEKQLGMQPVHEKKTAAYILTRKLMMELVKPDAIIMHPMPRNDEIARDVDSDPRAMFFKQSGNGVVVRMAILKMLLS